eukprot:PLAT13003.1.p1 GENE.PLAT13003.1~~PLAT13003.1.p1  ORF type:complete len:576 (-),score=184.30 PLAT13003.1:111-1778(-)
MRRSHTAPRLPVQRILSPISTKRISRSKSLRRALADARRGALPERSAPTLAAGRPAVARRKRRGTAALELASLRSSLSTRRKKRAKGLQKQLKDMMMEERAWQDRKWLKLRGRQSRMDFTRSERLELKRWFDTLDADGSGEISLEELMDPLLSIGAATSMEDLQKLIQDVDTSGNGEIDFEEFITALQPSGSTSERAKMLLQLQQEYQKTELSMPLLVSSHRRRFLINSLISRFRRSRTDWGALERAAVASHDEARVHSLREARKRDYEMRRNEASRMKALFGVVEDESASMRGSSAAGRLLKKPLPAALPLSPLPAGSEKLIAMMATDGKKEDELVEEVASGGEGGDAGHDEEDEKEGTDGLRQQQQQQRQQQQQGGEEDGWGGGEDDEIVADAARHERERKDDELTRELSKLDEPLPQSTSLPPLPIPYAARPPPAVSMTKVGAAGRTLPPPLRTRPAPPGLLSIGEDSDKLAPLPSSATRASLSADALASSLERLAGRSKSSRPSFSAARAIGRTKLRSSSIMSAFSDALGSPKHRQKVVFTTAKDFRGHPL